MECLKCNYHASLKTNYERHLLTKKHLQDKPVYTCDMCGYLAPTKQAYERHQKTFCCKEPIQYNCDACDYATLSKQNYDLHLTTQLHHKITRPINVKDVTPEYLLSTYHKSAVKYGLYYMGYRRLSSHSIYIIYKNKLVSIDDYRKAYDNLENTLKQEQGYKTRYERYAYVNKHLCRDLHYPFA